MARIFIRLRPSSGAGNYLVIIDLRQLAYRDFNYIEYNYIHIIEAN